MIAGGGLQRFQFNRLHLGQPFAVLGDFDAQFRGDFLLGRIPAYALAGPVNRGFDPSRPFAGLARRPVHLPQAVQDGAADLPLGIGIELHVERGIEVVDGRQQPHHAARDQVVERDMAGQPVVDTVRNHAHLREMPEHERFPLVRGVARDRGTVSDSCGGHLPVLGNCPARELVLCRTAAGLPP